MKVKFQIEKDDIIYAVSREISEEKMDSTPHPAVILAYELGLILNPVLEGANLPEVFVV